MQDPFDVRCLNQPIYETWIATILDVVTGPGTSRIHRVRHADRRGDHASTAGGEVPRSLVPLDFVLGVHDQAEVVAIPREVLTQSVTQIREVRPVLEHEEG